MPTNDDLQYRTATAAEESVLLEQAKRDEKAFIVSERQTVTASGGTFNLHLLNPPDSGRDLNIRSVHYETQFEGVVDMWDAFSSAPSGGTTVTVDNLLMDQSGEQDMGTMTANADVTFAGDGTHFRGVIPSGGPGGSMGGALNETEPILEPGREIVIEIENQSGSDDDGAITVVYVEESRE